MFAIVRCILLVFIVYYDYLKNSESRVADKSHNLFVDFGTFEMLTKYRPLGPVVITKIL